MIPSIDDQIRRIAARCGDCRMLFDDIKGEYCYARQQPARLICEDCKLRETPSEDSSK